MLAYSYVQLVESFVKLMSWSSSPRHRIVYSRILTVNKQITHLHEFYHENDVTYL